LQISVKSKSPGKKGSGNLREYFFWNPSPKYSTNAQADIKNLDDDPSRKIGSIDDRRDPQKEKKLVDTI
jgi:hypothetical protein